MGGVLNRVPFARLPSIYSPCGYTTLPSLTYGYYGGGYTSTIGYETNRIDYIDKTLTTGNAIDRGNLSMARGGMAGVYGRTYGYYGGGMYSFLAFTNRIDYMDATITSGNAADRGDLPSSYWWMAGTTGPCYGFFCGGVGTGAVMNNINYLDISLTSGNASDRGDLSLARTFLTGVSRYDYSFVGGGLTGTGSVWTARNEIDYFATLTTSGNATDRGNLTLARGGSAGVYGGLYGFWGGGSSASDGGGHTNRIDYINMSLLTGNATDRGDLSVSRVSLAGVSGSTYGFFGGGDHASSPPWDDEIDYISIATTTGNATDRGNLSQARNYPAGV